MDLCLKKTSILAVPYLSETQPARVRDFENTRVNVPNGFLSLLRGGGFPPKKTGNVEVED